MTNTLEILYNSVCPVCREGICYFETRTQSPKTGSAGQGVTYVDVSADPKRFRAEGVSLDDVRFKLHARLPDGQIIRGWPAISALWRVTPGYKWLAILGDAPVLNWGARGTNHLAAVVLWQWNKLSGRW